MIPQGGVRCDLYTARGRWLYQAEHDYPLPARLAGGDDFFGCEYIRPHVAEPANGVHAGVVSGKDLIVPTHFAA